MTNGFDLYGDNKDVIAVKINGVLKDMSSTISDTEIENTTPVTLDSEDGLHVLRHSTAHVLAQAVQNTYENVSLGIGPVIDDGFYYDFDLDTPFTPEDFKKIEKAMLKIVNQNQKFVRREISQQDVDEVFKNEPYKLQLIKKKGSDDETGEAQTLTVYENVSQDGNVCWLDLCKGPHLPTTKYIKNAFKLMKSSSAYWLGDSKNKMLQRIYGTAWASKEELVAYTRRIEEAEKRDHRKIGTQLDLFSFPDEIGSGLPVFHPAGGIIRLEMEDYSRKKHKEAGYSFVNTPHITKGRLYEISGHLNWYKDSMYPPMHIDEERDEKTNEITKQGVDYYLKPMNCPMHNLIYRSTAHSYKELPLRLFEFGTVYRYEQSGVVHGMTRVRGLTQDDAHIYCQDSQMEDELTKLLHFVLNLLKDYGLDDFYLEISTRNPEKSVGSDEIWELATETLRKVATDSGLKLIEDEGGAAFYGPKISVQARDAIGRSWQMSTIQLDFNLPELFELEYQAPDGSKKRPVMIHRALFGSIERFFGVLTEHYAGAFPAWLSPTQVLGIPVSDEFAPYLQGVLDKLSKHEVRAKLDMSDDRFAKKIRNASKMKIPFVLIAGQEDFDNNSVSFRFRDGTQDNGIPIDEAIERILDVIRTKKNN
jgi:threonyl-tRNA synthetase